MISVIIPNYNHASYLNQRIDSVLNQTFQDFELILLDDCSTDNSRQVIESYRGHERVSQIVYNQTNSKSTFKQWEKGLAIAKGRLIWIAESDDYATPDLLEKAVAVFSQHPDVGIVKLASVWVDQNDQVLQEETISKANFLEGKKYAIDNMSFSNSLYNASAIVFKKELAMGVIDEDIKGMRFCGDWLFWNRILVKTSVALLADKCNFFRKHSGNVSSGAEKAGLFYLEGIKSYIEVRKHNAVSRWKVLSPDKIWAWRLNESKLPSSVLVKFFSRFCLYTPFILPLYLYYKARNILK